METSVLPIRLIVGLGNPGSAYEHTRHNAGKWFVEALLSVLQLTPKESTKFHGMTANYTSDSHNCWLLMPNTFMNHSGRAVVAIANFYKIKPEEILVVHDELDFEAGKIRLKFSGGHGGHNGLRDVSACLNSDDYWRLRIGISHPGQKDLVSDYVLQKPTQQDRKLILSNIAEAITIIPFCLQGQFQRAMNELHC